MVLVMSRSSITNHKVTFDCFYRRVTLLRLRLDAMWIWAICRRLWAWQFTFVTSRAPLGLWTRIPAIPGALSGLWSTVTIVGRLSIAHRPAVCLLGCVTRWSRLDDNSHSRSLSWALGFRSFWLFRACLIKFSCTVTLLGTRQNENYLCFIGVMWKCTFDLFTKMIRSLECWGLLIGIDAGGHATTIATIT